MDLLSEWWLAVNFQVCYGGKKLLLFKYATAPPLYSPIAGKLLQCNKVTPEPGVILSDLPKCYPVYPL